MQKNRVIRFMAFVVAVVALMSGLACSQKPATVQNNVHVTERVSETPIDELLMAELHPWSNAGLLASGSALGMHRSVVSLRQRTARLVEVTYDLDTTPDTEAEKLIAYELNLIPEGPFAIPQLIGFAQPAPGGRLTFAISRTVDIDRHGAELDLIATDPEALEPSTRVTAKLVSVVLATFDENGQAHEVLIPVNLVGHELQTRAPQPVVTTTPHMQQSSALTPDSRSRLASFDLTVGPNDVTINGLDYVEVELRVSKQVTVGQFETMNLSTGGSLGGIGGVTLYTGQVNKVQIPYGSQTFSAGSTGVIGVLMDTSAYNVYGDWIEVEVLGLSGTSASGRQFWHTMQGPSAQWSVQSAQFQVFRVTKALGQPTTMSATSVSEALAVDLDVNGEDIEINRVRGGTFSLLITSSRTIDTVVYVSIPSFGILGETPVAVHLDAGIPAQVGVPVTVPLPSYQGRYTFPHGTTTHLSVSLETSGLSTTGNIVTVEFQGMTGIGVMSGVSYQATVGSTPQPRNTISRQ